MADACCSIGARPDASAIDEAIRAGGLENSIRKMAVRLGVSPAAVQRHRAHILGPDAGASGAVDTPADALRCGSETADTPPIAEEAQAPDSPRSRFDVPNPGDDPQTAPRKLITAQVEDECVDLRIRGKGWREIASVVGVNIDTAIDAYERALNRTRARTDNNVEKARDLELRRCDAVIDSFWDRATSRSPEEDPAGQDRAADRLLRALERRAKLLGLDAPTGPSVVVLGQVPGVSEHVAGAAAALLAILRLLAPEQAGRGRELYEGWLRASLAGEADATRDPAAWVLERARVIEAPALPEGGSG